MKMLLGSTILNVSFSVLNMNLKLLFDESLSASSLSFSSIGFASRKFYFCRRP